MKLLILTIITSSAVSLLVSHWYLKQMNKRTQQQIYEFFQGYKKEYRKFLEDLRRK